MIERILLFIRFRWRAGHRRGRGVHPPFACELVNGVIFGDDLPQLDRIEVLRRSLLRDRDRIGVGELGAGSLRGSGSGRRIGKLVRYTAVSRKTGQLLARLVSYFRIPRVIELGSGSGISGLYMGLAHSGSRILSCEGSAALVNLARRNARKLKAANVDFQRGDFRDWLPAILPGPDEDILVFIDGDHRGGKLLEYCRIIMAQRSGKLVLVLDDIHWSFDMFRAWTRLRGMEEIRLSLELNNTGILLVNFDVQHGRYIVDF